MSAIRGDRVNEEVKKTISEIIREMKDPRISSMTTLTGCEVTNDFKYAKVRVSVYDEDDAKRAATVDALNHAAGFISREIGNRMRKEVKEAVTEPVEEKEEKVKIVYKEKERSLFSRIMNIVLWIILIVWMAICLIDFYRVTKKEDPMFCLKKETTKYDDGTVDSCLGVGYKVYNYNRTSYTAIEFGPFWTTDRSNQ